MRERDREGGRECGPAASVPPRLVLCLRCYTKTFPRFYPLRLQSVCVCERERGRAGDIYRERERSQRKTERVARGGQNFEQ